MNEQTPTPTEQTAQAPARRTRWRWAAGIGGVAVAAAIAVPAVSYAATTSSTQDTGSSASCTVGDRAAARATSAPLVRDYLAAHPDVNTELTKIKDMPKDQRRAEAKTYFTAHPDVKDALKQAGAASIQFRKNCPTTGGR